MLLQLSSFHCRTRKTIFKYTMLKEETLQTGTTGQPKNTAVDTDLTVDHPSEPRGATPVIMHPGKPQVQNGWHQKNIKMKQQNNIKYPNISKHCGMTMNHGHFDSYYSCCPAITGPSFNWHPLESPMAIHLRSTEMWMEKAPQLSHKGGFMRWRNGGKCWKLHELR